MPLGKDIGLGLGFIIGLSFLALLLAFVLPAQVIAINGDSDIRFPDQSENESVSIYRSLNSTTTMVNNTNVTVELLDSRTGDTAIETFGIESKTLSIRDSNITVTVDSIETGQNTTDITYRYPNDYALPAGLITILSSIDIIVLSIIFLVILGLGAKAIGVL